MTPPAATQMLRFKGEARATANGAENWSLLEHTNTNRHDPSGFKHEPTDTDHPAHTHKTPKANTPTRRHSPTAELKPNMTVFAKLASAQNQTNRQSRTTTRKSSPVQHYRQTNPDTLQMGRRVANRLEQTRIGDRSRTTSDSDRDTSSRAPRVQSKDQCR